MTARRPLESGARLLLILAPLCLLCSCSESGEGRETAQGPGRADGSMATRSKVQAASARGATATAVSTPFDVSAVMRQVHLAFRPRGAGFDGGHTTHGLQVDADLRVRFTPVHHQGAPAQPGATAPLQLPDPSGHPRQIRATEPRTGAPATFHTVELRRGDRVLAHNGAQVRVQQDGSLALDRGEVTERLRNTEAGVEQSWSLPRRPAGSGDLVVRVRVTGQRYIGSSASGLHFADQKSGLGVRYGWATLIDAGGARTAIRGRFIGGEIVIKVPAAVLQQARFPAVLDPVISAEYGMDQPVTGVAWRSQTRPSVAFDGTNYLVVWYDQRDTKTGSWDIYGARVSALGTVLDTSGIAISTASGHQQAPRVAYHGGNYLVVWHDFRNHSSYPDIYAARVTSNGVVLDKSGIAISTASYHQYHPEVLYGGGNFMVVWYDYRHSTSYADIYGARVSAAGKVLDTAGIPISRATRTQAMPQLAFDGANFLVVWYDYRLHSSYCDIYAARVSGAGVLLDKNGILISKASYYQQYPSVAYNAKSGNYFVVWQDYRTYSKYYWDVYGARVSKAGKLLDSSGIPISAISNHQLNARVAEDGTDFLVVWQDYRNQSKTGYDIYGARVNASGVVQDKSGVMISNAAGNQGNPTLAYSGSAFLVVWYDDRNASNIKTDIYGARVFPTGTVLNPKGIPISLASNSQGTPAAAYDGTNYLVVWSDSRSVNNSSWDIYGAVVSPSGTLVTKSGITISTATKDQTRPAVAFGGGKYLVVWEDYRGSYRDIYGAQVNTTGQVLQPVGFPVCNATYDQRYPSLAYDGANFLAVWQDHRNSTTYGDIYGTRINTYGGVISTTGFAISKETYYQSVPAVAYGVGSYLVVWEDSRTSTSNYDIYGTRVTTVGTVVDSKGIAIDTNSYHQRNPSVGHDGTTFLVAWEDYRDNTNTGWDIFGARVSSAGNVMDATAVPISTPAGNQLRPRVSGHGGNFLVVWEDYRNGAYNPDIYGAEVSGAGSVQQALGIPISTDKAAYEVNPSLASAGSAGVMVTYAVASPTKTKGAYRIRARTIAAKTQNGGACTTGSTCKSGVCADGVCCDKPCGGSATDCQACSVAAGAAVDGTCGAIKAGKVCRALAGLCDTAEVCDGTALTCPADKLKAVGTACRGALGLCDVAESCDGNSADCPTDLLQPAGTPCRKAAGPCDEPSSCSGSAAVCAANAFKPTTAVCRAATGECDQAESCSGAGASCPQDDNKPNGTACSKGLCKAGICIAGDLGPMPDQSIPDQSPPDITPDIKVEPDKGPDMGPDKGPDMGPDKGQPDTNSGDICAQCRGGDCQVVVEESDGCSYTGRTPSGAPLLLVLLLGLWTLRRRRR